MITTTQITRKLEDFIVSFDKLVPEELCDRIVSEYQKDPYWAPATLVGERVDKRYRNCDLLKISDSKVIGQNSSVRQKIDEDMYSCASYAINEYRKMFPIQTEIDTGYDLLRYNEGQFQNQHTDYYVGSQRTISCSFHLNNDYEGGEFAFFDREIVIRAGKGGVIMFPSNFMFPHEVMPILSGTRYSIITWHC
jgi:predicted 2-oxoglutarate/Fe(II)-dependent dioxygenase YbiX